MMEGMYNFFDECTYPPEIAGAIIQVSFWRDEDEAQAHFTAYQNQCTMIMMPVPVKERGFPMHALDNPAFVDCQQTLREFVTSQGCTQVPW
jgi:hypothetical protein